jgi:hypothetical protein
LQGIFEKWRVRIAVDRSCRVYDIFFVCSGKSEITSGILSFNEGFTGVSRDHLKKFLVDASMIVSQTITPSTT